MSLAITRRAALAVSGAAAVALPRRTRAADRQTIRIGVLTDLNGPNSNGTGEGRRLIRAPIQATCRSANSRALAIEARCGIVRMTSRVADRTRNVKRFAPVTRRNPTWIV